MNKIAVVIYGPPGSGKGTQAKLLAERKRLIHFDTGRYIENVVHDPKNKGNKIIDRERELFDNGTLNTPTWVLKIVKDGIKKISAIGSGVVFSGSPRTMFEAFGDGKTEGVISILEKLYGRENLHILSLRVKDEDSINRNSHRLICTTCDLQIIGTRQNKIKECPFCGGQLGKRTLDDKNTIKTRLQEYTARTKPIEKELRKRKYKIHAIDASPLPYKIFDSIMKRIFK